MIRIIASLGKDELIFFVILYNHDNRTWKKTQYGLIAIPADKKLWINVDLTLVPRRRRWTNIKPTSIQQRLVSAGI